MESSEVASKPAGLRVQMLGPFALSRAGRKLTLPASRKLRALFAYLALAPRPVSRSRLCELLWEAPNDPRGELRWYLSRIRSAVDEPEQRRVLTGDDSVALDLKTVFVDAVRVIQALGHSPAALPLARKRELATLFKGEFLEGLDIDRSPVFNGWLTAQRRRFRSWEVALLEQLAQECSGEEASGYLEKWLQLAPFDRRAHEMLLQSLAYQNRTRDAEAHLASALALFESEGLDAAPLREAWRLARAQAMPASADAAAVVAKRQDEGAHRAASIAVMPFADHSSEPAARGSLADALAHDLTTRLARLRSLFVISQGSAFALHERRIGPEEAGRMLNVEYVLGGAVRHKEDRIAVTVELVETRSARVVWSELLNQRLDDTFWVLEQIGNRIVASIAAEIEAIERNRAILQPPNSLNAWEAHHRGLWHMYRFTRADNAQARHFFEAALRLDPVFARAHAGLSFTHFQDAFQGWGRRAAAMEHAYAAAGQSLMADDRDPAAHLAYGRALWLRGDGAQAVLELERAIDLSPNFAMAHYTLAFVQSQTGDAEAAIVSVDRSRGLSPFDPLLFGMFGSRAIALARLGRQEEAADWAVKAAARPNAHAHIYALAVCCCGMAGQTPQMRAHATQLRRMAPRYRPADFFAAFRFDAQGLALFRKASRWLGAD